MWGETNTPPIPSVHAHGGNVSCVIFCPLGYPAGTGGKQSDGAPGPDYPTETRILILNSFLLIKVGDVSANRVIIAGKANCRNEAYHSCGR